MAENIRNRSFSLKRKVACLMQPKNYPEKPDRVTPIETHMSWVFLTDRHAYKLKKPVRYNFMDFSTVAARHRDCKNEVRLNRRLAPDVYLGIVPLTVDESGNMRLDGEGEVIDWLIKMRRLPADRMLDYTIKKHTIREEEFSRIASVLAKFYKDSPPIPIGLTEYRDRLEQSIHANRLELSKPEFGLPVDRIGNIATSLLQFLSSNAPCFDKRVREGRIIEAHGDLRPEHICMEFEPVIFDCLEFNREFRILDTADDLAYLALECERLGVPTAENILFATYRRLTGDDVPKPLICFYKGNRAFLRAKLAIWHTHETTDAQKCAHWLKQAAGYLRLAERQIDCFRL